MVLLSFLLILVSTVPWPTIALNKTSIAKYVACLCQMSDKKSGVSDDFELVSVELEIATRFIN